MVIGKGIGIDQRQGVSIGQHVDKVRGRARQIMTAPGFFRTGGQWSDSSRSDNEQSLQEECSRNDPVHSLQVAFLSSGEAVAPFAGARSLKRDPLVDGPAEFL